MAGTSQREVLKWSAIQALEQSRGTMAGELATMRERWSPRKMVREGVEKHKTALIIAGVAVAGLITIQFLRRGRSDGYPQGPQQRSWLAGLLTTGLMAVVRQPLTDLAKGYLSNYLKNLHPVSQPEQSE